MNETVDIYVNRLRTLGRRIGLEADDNTLLYALLSGLKPSLSGFVIGKKSTDLLGSHRRSSNCRAQRHRCSQLCSGTTG